MMRILDPIHGSVGLCYEELAVVDHPVFQRLRGIKQLGFADQAFPGATHTRYAHSLGAMEVASRMFDALFPERALPAMDRARLRQLTRLGLLLHDLGHPPASHASEPAMPTRRALGLSGFSEAELDEQASHEDYTLKLLLDSPLTDLVDRTFGDGISAKAVAHLICGRYPETAGHFVVQGVDYQPVLSQVVSGEMDADRMDYLQRDSFFAGVNYGKFDQHWLLENLEVHIHEGKAYMALGSRAVFAFEHFLLSRYHMFVSVYYHYIPVGFDTMLVKFYAEAPDDFRLPADALAYATCDDIALWSALRRSKNRWAQRIARREAFRRVLELQDGPEAAAMDQVCQALEAAKIEHFTSRDRGILSKYYRSQSVSRPIFVVDRSLKRVDTIDHATRIFERYAEPAHLVRLYVRPDQVRAARPIVDELLPTR